MTSLDDARSGRGVVQRTRQVSKHSVDRDCPVRSCNFFAEAGRGVQEGIPRCIYWEEQLVVYRSG